MERPKGISRRQFLFGIGTIALVGFAGKTIAEPVVDALNSQKDNEIRKKAENYVRATAQPLSTPQNWNKEVRSIPWIAKDRSVELTIFSKQDKIATDCSGFQVAKVGKYDFILTASHCVKNSNYDLTSEFSGKYGISVTYPRIKDSYNTNFHEDSYLKGYISEQNDVGLLVVKGWKSYNRTIFAPISIKEEINLNKEYYSVSFPAVTRPTELPYIPVKIKLEEVDYENGYAYANVASAGGSSGSIVMDRDGVIIGVISATTTGEDIQIALTGKSMQEMFDNASKDVGAKLPPWLFRK